jgi:hypothetical protein
VGYGEHVTESSQIKPAWKDHVSKKNHPQSCEPSGIQKHVPHGFKGVLPVRSFGMVQFPQRAIEHFFHHSH